jgi:carboxylesterase
MAVTGAPKGWLEDHYKRGHGELESVGVLLLHGFTGSPASMRPWANYLSEKGVTVRVPRIPGHGTRWQDLNKVHWTEWSDRAEIELRKLRAECSKLYIFGLSMGGANTLFTTAKNQELVTGIVLVNPMIHITDPAIYLVDLIKYLVPKRPSVGDDIKKPGVTEWGYDALPTKGVAQLNRFLKATRKELPNIFVPTLLFHSAEDHVLPVSNTEIILKELGSKNKERIELSNSFHVATLDFDDQIIFDRSLKFVLDHNEIS